MKGLFGDLQTMPTEEVVVYLGKQKASGTLNLERAWMHKQLRLQKGTVVNASSNDPREFLGQFLINLGYITEEQFHRAYETQKQTKIFLGRILIMIGAVTEEMLLSVLNLKMRETLFEAFLWEEGSFAFLPEEAQATQTELKLSAPLLEMYANGKQRKEQWKTFRQMLPSTDIHFRVSKEKFSDILFKTSLVSRIVRLAEENHNLAEIALQLHATDFFLFQHIYALIQAGILTPKTKDEPLFNTPEEEAVSTSKDLLLQAQSCLKEGELREASLLAKRAHARTPTTETQALSQSTESHLLNELRTKWLEQKRTPILTIPVEQIKQLSLTPPERYLLSRIDGKRSLSAIIYVSPLREVEAISFFERFWEKGWVKFLQSDSADTMPISSSSSTHPALPLPKTVGESPT
ncbi:MAG: DUF4388 domain-containing protein [Cystobacterineae bacterium]|nr:DUF4388 domain-containing protein [Cystobacterineae bacterium]